MSTLTTIADLMGSASDDGTWVDVPFRALVSNATAGGGNKPSKADLTDPADPRFRVKAAWFGGNLLDVEGFVVEIGGKGIKAKTYKGNVEINIGKGASVRAIEKSTAAPPPRPAAGNAGTPGKAAAPAPLADPVAEEKRFHGEMKRIALLLFHSWQYTRDVVAKIGEELPPDTERAMMSSFFMTAKDRGLLARPPAPRAFNEDGTVVPFVPQKVEESPEQKAERERKAKEELERKHREDEERRKREELDEDVPF